LLVALIGLTG